MSIKGRQQPRRRLLKASCVGAGLLSISNPTQITAADLGVLDVFNGETLASIPNPFPNSPMGVHVAVGDLDGDGFAEVIMGPGRGPTSKIAGASKITKERKDMLQWYMDMSPSLPPHSGVSVATGDLDGDGFAEIIATPSTGAASTAIYIKIPDIKGETEEYATFPDIFEGHSGGVNVATGDLDGDGHDDVLAGRLSCACGRPIKKWPGISGLGAFEDFGPPVPSGQGGVRVAAGDVDGDGLADYMVVPIDPTTGVSQPLLATSKDDHKNWIEISSFNEPAGVHIAMGDLDGDGTQDLVVGSARGSLPYVKFYEILETPGVPGSFAASYKGDFHPYPDNFLGGVRVAIGDVTRDGYPDVAFAPGAIPEPATIASLLTGLVAWLFGWRRRKAPPG